jgi:hypothetical protein
MSVQSKCLIAISFTFANDPLTVVIGDDLVSVYVWYADDGQSASTSCPSHEPSDVQDFDACNWRRASGDRPVIIFLLEGEIAVNNSMRSRNCRLFDIVPSLFILPFLQA